MVKSGQFYVVKSSKGLEEIKYTYACKICIIYMT